jgi:hypothetical protein
MGLPLIRVPINAYLELCRTIKVQRLGLEFNTRLMKRLYPAFKSATSHTPGDEVFAGVQLNSEKH